MEWVIQLGALAITGALAVVLTLRYEPNALSEFELARQNNAGNAGAQTEQARRNLLPTYIALRSLKEITIITILAALLMTTHQPWVGALLTLLYLGCARVVAAQGWLAPMVGRAQMWVEARFQTHVQKVAPFVGWIAPKKVFSGNTTVASRDELRQLVAADTRLLAPDDKARLLGAFDFGTLAITDVMVPADQIATVDIKETVGPILLDRLHKANHRIFVVIKKDINQIKGLLYMHDLTPLDPALHDVKDALRPTVHYISHKAPLLDVLVASLVTGRQLFIAVDDEGNTKGLVTLADALQHLCGEPLPKIASVSTKPIMNKE